MVRSQYLKNVFTPKVYKPLIIKACEVLTEMMVSNPFDTIAFTGVSGAAIGFALGYELGLPMLCVRKQSEKSHYSATNGYVEGHFTAMRYIIVDDLIASGDTIYSIMNRIHLAIDDAECVGIFLYNDEVIYPENNRYGVPIRSIHINPYNNPFTLS
jgi:adenine/guanine phosphoribosyltransferase-like PRPP-binding protein